MLSLLRLAFCLLALCLTGCLQIESLVKVKPDGSGTIEEKFTMGGAVAAQMKSMAAAFGGDKAGGKGNGLYDEAKLKARAGEMGAGVTFVAGKPVTGADGSEGYTAVYAFSDVNQLKLSPNAGDLGPQAGPAKPKDGKKEFPVTFKFTKGQPATLTVVNPNVRTKPGKEPKAAEAEGADDAMLPMMKEMMKDMRVRMAVEVEGKIVQTTAQWQEGSRVTLMDVEMNKVLDDPARLKALMKFKDPNAPEAKAALAKIPGFKVETADTVVIKFQ